MIASLEQKLMDKALKLVSRRSYSVAKLREKLMKYGVKNHANFGPRFQTRKHCKPEKSSTDFDPANSEAKESTHAEAVERVLERLHELHYLDDLRYSERWVEERSRLKPRGKYLLTQELRKKGILKNVIEQFWEGEVGRNFINDEVVLAEQAAAKKRGQLEPKYEGAKLKNRLFRHLASRGFSYQTIDKVMERFF